MRSKAKWFIGISTLLIVLFCAGIYANYRLNQVVSSLNRPGVLFSDTQPAAEGQGENAESQSNSDYWNGSWGDGTGGTDSQGNGDNSGTGNSGDSGSGDKVNPPSNSQIADDVANRIGRPIEKTDMIKAGLIILKRMNGEEISYLYQVGKKGTMSSAERVQVRKILLNKLNSDDIATLKALGSKYGRDLSILDN